MKKEKVNGEEFWEAVEKFESLGYSNAAAIRAAHVLTDPNKGGIEETMWAVSFLIGKRRALYTGTFLTRTAAKREHSSALGKTWAECEAKGDRIERVLIMSA